MKKRYIFLSMLAGAAIMLVIAVVVGEHAGSTREGREAEMKPEDVAVGKGCLDEDGNLPALVDYAKAQLADQDGFRPISTSLLGSDKVPPDVGKGQSLISMHFAGKNQMGGMSFYDAIGLMKPSDCSLGFVDVRSS